MVITPEKLEFLTPDERCLLQSTVDVTVHRALQDLAAARFHLRELSEAAAECYGGDMLENCEQVSQTAAGDYDCDGCRWCNLHDVNDASHKIWNDERLWDGN